METERNNGDNSNIYLAVLDSLTMPVVFVDSQHCIRYLNFSGKNQYSQYGNILGKSIFDCHNPASAQKIKDIYIQLQSGAHEVIYIGKRKYKDLYAGSQRPRWQFIGLLRKV